MTELSTHTCHARDCDEEIPPAMFMCRRHWYKVPRYLREAIWEHYVPGQEVRKDPSEEYLHVAQIAIDTVARKEGK